jgi:hypothetical protein
MAMAALRAKIVVNKTFIVDEILHTKSIQTNVLWKLDAKLYLSSKQKGGKKITESWTAFSRSFIDVIKMHQLTRFFFFFQTDIRVIFAVIIRIVIRKSCMQYGN